MQRQFCTYSTKANQDKRMRAIIVHIWKVDDKMQVAKQDLADIVSTVRLLLLCNLKMGVYRYG